jgi:Family of unknown function (DUF5995)
MRATVRLRKGTSAIVTVLIAMGTLGLGQARAENVVIPNWPALLPDLPYTPSGTVPLGWDVCPKGKMNCPPQVIDEMIDRWQPLDQSCDHRAVFALTYLRTTQEFFRTVSEEPETFSDVPWINHEDAVFAELYFRAYDDYVAGRPVPAAWEIAFDAADSPHIQAMGDLLLGMNAHINRDLPYTLAHVGLVDGDGDSRKLDHDKVNLFLDRVIDPLQDELYRLYDPLIGTSDMEPSPIDEVGALALIRLLRENAWRNAKRLVAAGNPLSRALVSRSIEAEAASFALTIQAAATVPGYGPVRDAYCVAAH